MPADFYYKEEKYLFFSRFFFGGIRCEFAQWVYSVRRLFAGLAIAALMV